MRRATPRLDALLLIAAASSMIPPEAMAGVARTASIPREPRPRLIQPPRAEIDAWNAAVEARKAAKRARKLAKDKTS